MSVNSGLKVTKIIGQKKVFYIGREFQSLAVRGKKLVGDKYTWYKSKLTRFVSLFDQVFFITIIFIYNLFVLLKV